MTTAVDKNIAQALLDKDPLQIQQMTDELVPVVDVEDKVLAARTKADTHLMKNIRQGLLHRALSVLIYNSKGEFLWTRRASSKITFPGYYTNACCSHPNASPEEMDNSNDFIGIKKAAKRRMMFELGINGDSVQISDFHHMGRLIYMFESPEDPVWGEHELDHVLVIHKDLEIHPNPNEVDYCQYLSRKELEKILEAANRGEVKVSPWFYKIYKLFAHKYWDRLDDLTSLKESHLIKREKIKYHDIVI